MMKNTFSLGYLFNVLFELGLTKSAMFILQKVMPWDPPYYTALARHKWYDILYQLSINRMNVHQFYIGLH